MAPMKWQCPRIVPLSHLRYIDSPPPLFASSSQASKREGVVFTVSSSSLRSFISCSIDSASIPDFPPEKSRSPTPPPPPPSAAKLSLAPNVRNSITAVTRLRLVLILTTTREVRARIVVVSVYKRLHPYPAHCPHCSLPISLRRDDISFKLPVITTTALPLLARGALHLVRTPSIQPLPALTVDRIGPPRPLAAFNPNAPRVHSPTPTSRVPTSRLGAHSPGLHAPGASASASRSNPAPSAYADPPRSASPVSKHNLTEL
ncbi:hypothetical protein C8R44DRAFT_893141 [Mycena epipterygia]|nr:hypothetical protein C8R44DRAFT_893141 [Mycena epipterygia]